MNITELKTVLPYFFKADVVPFIRGPYAQGKTGAINEVAATLGYRMHTINGGIVADLGDIVGTLMTDREGNFSKFMPPQGIYELNEWAKAHPDKYGILFIDEVTRSTIPGFFNACMPIAVERKVHGLSLAPNVRVIFADNPAGDDYDTLDFNTDKARSSRFAYITLVRPVSEWLAFQNKKRPNSDVVGFIAAHPDTLDTAPPMMDVTKWAEKNGRGWDMVAALEDSGLLAAHPGLFFEAGMGCVGLEIQKYREHLATQKVSEISLEKALDEDAALKPIVEAAALTMKDENGTSIATGFLTGLASHLAAKSLTEKQVKRLQRIIVELPKETIGNFIEHVSKERITNGRPIYTDSTFLAALGKKEGTENGKQAKG